MNACELRVITNLAQIPRFHLTGNIFHLLTSGLSLFVPTHHMKVHLKDKSSLYIILFRSGVRIPSKPRFLFQASFPQLHKLVGSR